VRPLKIIERGERKEGKEPFLISKRGGRKGGTKDENRNAWVERKNSNTPQKS